MFDCQYIARCCIINYKGMKELGDIGLVKSAKLQRYERETYITYLTQVKVKDNFGNEGFSFKFVVKNIDAQAIMGYIGIPNITRNIVIHILALDLNLVSKKN